MINVTGKVKLMEHLDFEKKYNTKEDILSLRSEKRKRIQINPRKSDLHANNIK